MSMEVTEQEMRTEFERQHQGRNLTQHPMRGTYNAPPIAALWNQHRRTVRWMTALYEQRRKDEQGT